MTTPTTDLAPDERVQITRYDPAADIFGITEHPDNPRISDPTLIAESIEANGMVDPILVNARDGLCLGGNHTLQACRDLLDMTTIPTLYCDVDPAHGKRILVALNRATEFSYNDNQRLAAILREMVDTDSLAGTLYSSTDVDVLMRSVTDTAERSADAVRQALDETAMVRTPADRAADYEAASVRSIIVPLELADYDEVVAALIAIRRESGETNAQVIQRLVLAAAADLT